MRCLLLRRIFFLKFLCYEVFAKQKKKKCPDKYYLYVCMYVYIYNAVVIQCWMACVLSQECVLWGFISLCPAYKGLISLSLLRRASDTLVRSTAPPLIRMCFLYIFCLWNQNFCSLDRYSVDLECVISIERDQRLDERHVSQQHRLLPLDELKRLRRNSFTSVPY